MLAKLDAIESDHQVGILTAEDLTAVRRQLAEGQSLMRETLDRLRQSQEENVLITRRRDELESRLASLESDYEELLEKTIHDEETSDVDVAESMTELKVRAKSPPCIDIAIGTNPFLSKNKLEAQYAAKREAHLSEVADLKQQLELKANEVRNLNASIESLKSVNEELKVCFPCGYVVILILISYTILSGHLLLLRRASKVERILRRVRKISSGQGRPSTFSSQNSMESRNHSCETSRIAVRR